MLVFEPNCLMAQAGEASLTSVERHFFTKIIWPADFKAGTVRKKNWAEYILALMQDQTHNA